MILILIVIYRWVIFECVHGLISQNDGFVKVSNVYFDDAHVLFYFFSI